MLVELIIYLSLFVIFAIGIVKLMKKKHNFQKEQNSISEIEDYEVVENINKQNLNNNEDDWEDEKDKRAEEKKNKNKKKKPYQPKNYRGTDIEIAGFESAKDARKLKGETLTSSEKQVLNEEIQKDNTKIEEKPIEKIDLDRLKSGIAGNKSAIEKVTLEVKENYSMGIESGLDNKIHDTQGVMRAKLQEERSKNQISGGGRGL
jgi:hypothetical protein